MAEVTLTTYFPRDEANPRNLKIRSVESPDPRIIFPSGRLTGFYGTRDTLKLLGEAHKRYLKQGKELVRVDLRFDGGAFSIEKQTLERIKHSRVLNLMRSTVEVLERVSEILELPKREDPIFLVSQRPERLNRLFEHSDFSNIGGIVWGITKPGVTPKGYHIEGYYQLISIRDTSVVEKIDVRNFEYSKCELVMD